MNKPVKIVLFLLASTCLGAAAFAGFGALVTYRQGQPILPRDPSEPLTSPATLKAAAGAHSAIRNSLHNLDANRRNHAAHALDAAMRVTEILTHESTGSIKVEFTNALNQIKKARHHLQNGNMADTTKALQKAASAIETAANDLFQNPKSQLTPIGGLDSYNGAIVVNARGVRIGKLVNIRPASIDTGREAVVRLGVRSLFGLWDIGQREVTIPIDELLFGKRMAIGSVMVAMPTFISSPTEIAMAIGYPMEAR